MLSSKNRRKIHAIIRPFKNAVGVTEAKLARLLHEPKCEKKHLSFCTTVMNRFEHMRETILKNFEDNSDYENCEFVILNYSCPDSRTRSYIDKELYKYIENKRLKYFYYPDAKFYNMSHSRNMVFRLASGDILCSIDADNFTGKGFANYINIAMRNKNLFLRGPIDGRGLGGRVCIYRQHFLEVGGYDERFVGWGGEDGDIANRLKLLGLKRKTIQIEKYLQSLSHKRDIRVEQYPEDKKIPSESRLANKLIADKNLETKSINPNGDQFGMGRVQDYFGKWRILEKL